MLQKYQAKKGIRNVSCSTKELGLGKSIVLYVAAAAKSLQSCPTLCDPQMAAHQAPPSLGFSRQEHWSGLPFPSPTHESENKSEVARSCPTLSDPRDCSPPGSSAHGIFQARVLEWGAIAFSSVLLSKLIILKILCS